MRNSSLTPRRARVSSAARAVVEQLEERRLLSTNGDYVSLAKAAIASQTGDSAPVVESYFFSAEIDESADPDGNVTNPKLTLPDDTQDNMIVSDPSVTATYTLPFADSAAMDASFPAGTYNVDFDDNTGEHDFDLSLGADNFPQPAQITNFTALQSADSTQDISINWNPLDGGTASDFVQVGIAQNGNTVFESDPFGEPAALNGSDTSFTVPAGTLAPGESYVAHIVYVFPVTEDTSDPNVDAASGYESLTEFALTTQSAGSVPAPTGFLASAGTFPHHVQLTWAAAAGATNYQVFRSTTNDFSTATKIAGGLTTLDYLDTTATPGVLYYYWVRGRNPTTVGSPSADQTGYIPLAAPTLAVAGLPHHIALTWTAVTGASGYQIFRGITSNVSDATKIQSGITVQFFNDTSVSPGQTYWYWVRARNPVGVGLFSNAESSELDQPDDNADFGGGTVVNGGKIYVATDPRPATGNGSVTVDIAAASDGDGVAENSLLSTDSSSPSALLEAGN